MAKAFLKFFIPVIILMLLWPKALHASIINNVTIYSVSSEYSRRESTNLVNGVVGGNLGSGLLGNNQHSPNPGGAMWLANDNSSGAYTNGYVTFDLGAVHTLQKMRVWNYGESSHPEHGVRDASLLIAGDDMVFTVLSNNVTLAEAPGGYVPGDFSQDIDLGGVQAHYVRLNVLDYFGASDNRPGLSEVQFMDTNVAPMLLEADYGFLSNRVEVTFSEMMSPTTATNLANYTITSSGGSVAIMSATMDTLQEKVELETASPVDSTYTLAVSNVTALTEGPSVNATVPLQSELALWLKADAGVTTNSSGLVSAWADQSGYGNDAVQADASVDPVFQPTYMDNGMNGMPAVRFVNSAGISNYMEVPYSLSMSMSPNFTVFEVIKFDDASQKNTMLSRAVANAAAPIDLYQQGSTVKCYRGNAEQPGGAYGSAQSTNGLASNAPGIIDAWAKGTNMLFYLNGVIAAGGYVLDGVRDSQEPTRLGSRDDWANPLNGNIAEIMLFRGAVSDEERLAINNYLGNKYGITVSDIVFTQQPKDTTKLEGQTATFTVQVLASSLAISYQWQEDGTNIVGATNATYTTPILTPSDSGEVYRVQVSVPGTSQYSDTAALNVVADTQPPTVAYAGTKLWFTNQIVVVFSEAVDSATGTTIGNYQLDNGATVNAATIGDSPNKVVLTVTGAAFNVTVMNVKDLYANTLVTVAVPVGIYPSLALWLRADAGVTADGSGLVSEWDDQSGNANNAFQPGGTTYEPLFVANDFNGQPALHFDGTNNYLVALSSSSLAVAGDMAIYAVVQFTDYSSAGGNEIIGKTAGTANNIPASYDFYAGPGSGRVRFYRGDGASYQNVTGVDAPSTDAPHIIVANMLGSTASQYMDGMFNGSSEISVPIADGGGPLGIGARSDYGSPGSPLLKGDMAELMIFNVALSDSDRAALDNYLGGKYAIAMGASPKLAIAPLSGNSFTLSWPTPTVTYVLESSPDLPAAMWTAVTNQVMSSSGNDSVTIQATNARQFYRLHKQ